MQNIDPLTILSSYDTIFLVWWGSGWHIQPILNMREHFRTRGMQRNFLWIGGKHSAEEVSASWAWISFREITTLKLATTRSIQVFLYPLIVLIGIFQALIVLTRARKERTCVFSKWGSSAGLSVGISAWILRIPLYIHESDTIPWRVNRFMGWFATHIFLGFPEAKRFFPEKKCLFTGQILHPAFSENEHKWKIDLEWRTRLPHILVVCGSQGSRAIFEAIIGSWMNFPKAEWIIALGNKNRDMQEHFIELNKGIRASEWWLIQVSEWLSQETLAGLIRGADIALTRGSATTLAELTYYNGNNSSGKNIKLIIIPLPYSAMNHQFENAKVYERMGHTILIQTDLWHLTDIVAKSI